MDANRHLSSLVDIQNAAIAHLQSAAQKKAKEAANALARAKEHAKHYNEDAQRIQAFKGSDDECADMRALLNGYFRR